MRIAVVGAGIAGTTLAWRLSGAPHRASVDLYDFARGRRADATEASGGLVRGFEPDPELCLAAAQSLAELRASPTLRGWSSYSEVGSVYFLPTGHPPSLAALETWLPGSARCVPGEQTPLRPRGEPTVAVVEQHAGYIRPAALRAALLASLPSGRGQVIGGRVDRVGDGSVWSGDGRVERYDAVVLATGPWTPTLLRRSGLRRTGLRTKLIQYAMVACAKELPSAFVDAATGLYGRPDAPGCSLLGLPGDRWDVPAASQRANRNLVRRSAALIRSRLGEEWKTGPVIRLVARTDCFSDRPGLRLRPVTGTAALFTFTGGSGCAAKSALASSSVAAAELEAGAQPIDAAPKICSRQLVDGVRP